MKKILSVLLVALLALPLSAQNVYRTGNKYFVEGQVLKKKAFAEYMQQNAEANLSTKFQSGLKVANAGWGLFGAGLGLEVAGLICTGAGTVRDGQPQQALTPLGAAGVAMYLVGGASLTSSIICLGVGYARMHKAADLYAAVNNKKPQAYLSVKADGNGLGVALNF